MPKVVNGLSWTFVCKMGVGPRTNVCNIGGDPLTQLILFNLFINFNFFFFFFQNVWICRHSQKMNGKTFWWWPTDPLMQSIVHSSLSKAVVINNIVHTNLSKICRVTSYIWSDTYRRYVSCIGSNVSRYVSYRIIQTIHNPSHVMKPFKPTNNTKMFTTL